jgi:hypothetical protein
MQESLFDVSGYIDKPMTVAEKIHESEFPLLKVLGITIDGFEDHESQLLRVELVADSIVYDPGYTYTSKFTNVCGEEENLMHWKVSKKPPSVVEGYLETVSRLNDPARTPILHLLEHVTDIDSCSTGVRLSDIRSIWEYHKDPADVKAAYQNAVVDGDTYFYQGIKGISTDVVLTPKDLDPFVNGYFWPEPKLIYARDET